MRYLTLLLIALASVLPDYASAQKKPSDYIVLDSTFSMGDVSILRNEKIQFKRNKKAVPETYGPNDILEYGYDGRVFESLPIEGEKKFAERLVNEQTKLYKTKTNYLIKTDSNILVLTSSNYQNIFQTHFKCEGKEDAVAKLSYTKIALRTYIKSFNRIECDVDHFPHRKLGFYGGFSSLQFSASVANSLTMSDNTLAPSAGIFYDLPLFRPRALYFTIDLNSLYANPLFYVEAGGNSSYFGLHVRGVTPAVNAKWFFIQQGISAYIKAGAFASFVATSSPTGLIETFSNGATVEISHEPIENASDILFGGNAGFGIEIPVSGKKNFHLEARYQKAFEGNFNSFKMDFSGYSLVAGFNF